MSKETFLEELRGYLEILEDQEQQDILEEYEQHIDIKVQNGQSEEEAIRDFGPVRELAAEILEAYHVKPEFGESRRQKGLPGIGGMNLKDGEKKLRGIGAFLKKQLKALWGGIGRLFHGAGHGIKKGFHWMAGPFYRKKEQREGGAPGGTASLSGEQKTGREGMGMDVSADTAYVWRDTEKGKGSRRGTVPQSLSGFFGKLFRGIAALFCWCVRLIWNVFWAGAAVSAGCFALMALFGAGMLMILAVQSYPLWGAVLVCLGSFLAGGSMSGLCFSLLRRKRKKEEQKDRRGCGGEKDIPEDGSKDETENDFAEESDSAYEERTVQEQEEGYVRKYRSAEPETDWQGGAL